MARKRRILTRKDLAADKSSKALLEDSFYVSPHSMEILEEARRCWDSLDPMRRQRRRNKRYVYGDQWGDLITDSHGKTVTESQYLRMQGRTPLQNNVILPIVRNVIGQFRNNKTEPVCVARDRDEQKAGEMMSVAMQYVYQLNQINETDARLLEENLLSGVVASKTVFGWRTGVDKMDVWVSNVPSTRIFFDNGLEDPRHWDISMIGELIDMSIEDVVSEFANTKAEETKIRQQYASVSNTFNSYMENLDAKKMDNLVFYTSIEPSECRVLEIWKRESRPRYRCHDILKGELYKIEENEIVDVIEENKRRVQQCVEAGIPQEEASIIEAEWFIDRFWCYYFMTPNGYVLRAGESPYWHKEHPYSIKVYPLLDGEAHPFVGNFIDSQRYINRMIILSDYAMSVSAKGALLLPEGLLSDDMSMEDFRQLWANPASVIPIKDKAGVKPEQIIVNANNTGAMQMIELQMQLLDKTSGVSGAMQGQVARGNTPSSLYAQQAQNSMINLVDVFDSFRSFREQRDRKTAKIIQQFYDEERMLNIAGSNYREEVMYYRPEVVRNVEIDLSIGESVSTPAYREIANSFLMELWKAGSIDVEMLLSSGAFPFADKLLSDIQAKKEEMMEQQMQAQGAAMSQTGGDAPMQRSMDQLQPD